MGWYNLHVGLKPPSFECCEVLAREWSHCPAEDDSLLRSCIVGQVRLDKCYQVDGSTTPDPWYIATAGNFCYTIGAAREFQTLVSNIKGRLDIWYVRDDAVKQCLLETASVALLRMFHSSDAAFCAISSRDSPMEALLSFGVTSWPLRAPRKKRRDAGKPRHRARKPKLPLAPTEHNASGTRSRFKRKRKH